MGTSLLLIAALAGSGCHSLDGMQQFASTHEVGPRSSKQNGTDELPPEIISHRSQLESQQWQSGELWPGPFAGPEALLALKSTPRFRWSIATSETQVASADEQVPASDAANETTASAEEAVRDTTPETSHSRTTLSAWWVLSGQNDAAGWKACVLLAQSAPEKLDTKRMKLLHAIVAGEVSVHESSPSSGDTHEDSSQGSRFLDRFRSPNGTDGLPSETTVDPPAEEPVEVVLAPELRAAAAEAWCFALSRRLQVEEQTYRDAGLLLMREDLPTVVRCELFRGVARGVAPRRIPGLNEALQGAEGLQPELRLAALDACLVHALHHPVETPSVSRDEPDLVTVDLARLDPEEIWPPALWKLRWEESPAIVKRFGHWLALTGNPLAESYLGEKLNHLNADVKQSAVCSLGLIATDSSEALLRERLKRDQGRQKAVAMLALGYRDPGVVYRQIHDSDPSVRRYVAEFAGRHPSHEARVALQEMVVDNDPAIQLVAVQAVENWSAADAFPILSTAFQEGVLKTRREARRLLEQQFDLVIAAIEDTPEQRRTILDQIRQNHALALASETASVPMERPVESVTSYEEIERQIRSLLQKLMADEQSAEQRVKVNAELKTLVGSHPRYLDEALRTQPMTSLRKTLLRLAEVPIERCQTVRELSDAELHRRRKAAREIASWADGETLPEWILLVLADDLNREQDPQVCRAIMTAIAHDTTPAARAVAEVALRHPWSDVRVLGCQYAAQHRLPQLAPLLLPLLQERNATVQVAAIEAAGLCRNPLVIDGISQSEAAGRSGLRSLLGTVSGSMELRVLIALARLQNDQGRSELIKLTYSPAPEQRRLVVEAIAELEDPFFQESLLNMGWTEQDPQVRRVLLDALERMVDPSRRPEIRATATYDEKISAWAQWTESGAAAERQ